METFGIVLLVIVLVLASFYLGVRTGMRALGKLLIEKIKSGDFGND